MRKYVKAMIIIIIIFGLFVGKVNAVLKCDNCGGTEVGCLATDQEIHEYVCLDCEYTTKKPHDYIKEAGIWICSGCKLQDTRHKPTDNWFYDKEKHYKKCELDGCEEMFEEGKHIDGTHENDGTCSICGAKYQTHNLDTAKFRWNQDGHIYGCSYENCEGEFFSEHAQGEDIFWSADKHWYNCTNEDCEIKYKEEEHSDGKMWTGICVTCKRMYEGDVENFELTNLTVNECYLLEEVGDTVQIEIEYLPENYAAEFSFEIEDEKIATVTGGGVITAVSKGVTTLHIICGNKELEASVYVAFEGFEIEAEDKELVEGEETQICDESGRIL